MKNGKPIDWETRLTRLEDDVRQIKSMLQNGPPKRGWQAMVGSLSGDPVYDEIRKVTMELIEKDRRRARRAAAKARQRQ